MANTEQNPGTHWKKVYNYNYMGDYSLSEGQERVFTIKEAKSEEVVGEGGKKSICVVAYYEEEKKPMILNKTNCKVISKLYGTPLIEHWKGLKVIVYVKKNIQVGKEFVDALRIRDYKPGDNTLEEIKKLLEQKKGNMQPDQVERASEVINNQQREYYKSLHKLLLSL